MDKQQPIALITGAARGIGAAIAKQLSADGYIIWANYRSNHEAASLLKQEIEEQGGQCVLVPFDVADEEQVNQALSPLLENATPDVLVNNAGFSRDSLMVWMSSEDWQAVTDVTLRGFFLVTKQVLLGMMKQRKGVIVNVASTAGQSGLAGQANYSAAKAGLIGATKSLAKEVIKRKVRVNCVAPGFVETDMTNDLPVDEIKKTIPAGRFGKVEEIAGVVSFLCSDAAAYIVGETISVNGGIYT